MENQFTIQLHQTHHPIGDFQQIFSDLIKTLSKQKEDQSQRLHVYPELYLTGYPLQDLCQQKFFWLAYLQAFEHFSTWCQNQQHSFSALIGGLDYDFDQEGNLLRIHNVIFYATNGAKLRRLYSKKLLPNYDIFDEKKYFTPGKQDLYNEGIWSWQGLKIGLMICEDMWTSSCHELDPVGELWKRCRDNKTQLNAIINLSASPFFVGKLPLRKNRAQTISQLFKTPFIYCNRVGAEDEVLFDGASFVQLPNTTAFQLSSFSADQCEYQLPSVPLVFNSTSSEASLFIHTTTRPNTFESLFHARLNYEKTLPQLPALTALDCEEILDAIQFAFQDYAQKNGFNEFVVAVSGGLDSALVLTILKLGLKKNQKLHAIFMASEFSSSESRQLSEQLCLKLGINLIHYPIKFLHSNLRMSCKEHFNSPLKGLADENIQSRLRGLLLYTFSNLNNGLVINTSNKSEIAVGYSTLYGDSVGALCLLGDLYKSELYSLAEYINQHYGQVIPVGIIERAPTAELRSDQTDQQSLPPYQRLDAILEGILSNQYSTNDLVNYGFSTEEVQKAFNLYHKSEYKRFQFGPIVKLRPKSFGFGYRVPICKNIKELKLI